MNPNDASVYANTWSTQTWVLLFTMMIVFVMALMIAFIALVHRTTEHSADTPRTPVLDLPTADQASVSPPHAA